MLMRFVDILQQYAYGLLEENTNSFATLGECHLVYQDDELYEIDKQGKRWKLSQQMFDKEFLNRTFVKKVGVIANA